MEDASRSNGNNWQNSWNDLQQTIGGWVDKGVSHLPESAQNVVRGREKLIAMGAAVCTGTFASHAAMIRQPDLRAQNLPSADAFHRSTAPANPYCS